MSEDGNDGDFDGSIQHDEGLATILNVTSESMPTVCLFCLSESRDYLYVRSERRLVGLVALR